MSLHGGSAYPHDKTGGAGKLEAGMVGAGFSPEMIDRKIAEVRPSAQAWCWGAEDVGGDDGGRSQLHEGKGARAARAFNLLMGLKMPCCRMPAWVGACLLQLQQPFALSAPA